MTIRIGNAPEQQGFWQDYAASPYVQFEPRVVKF